MSLEQTHTAIGWLELVASRDKRVTQRRLPATRCCKLDGPSAIIGEPLGFTWFHLEWLAVEGVLDAIGGIGWQKQHDFSTIRRWKRWHGVLLSIVDWVSLHRLAVVALIAVTGSISVARPITVPTQSIEAESAAIEPSAVAAVPPITASAVVVASAAASDMTAASMTTATMTAPSVASAMGQGRLSHQPACQTGEHHQPRHKFDSIHDSAPSKFAGC